MSFPGPNHRQNAITEGRRIGTKDRRRKLSKPVEESTTKSSAILHGEEKDFDRTQWERTRFCVLLDGEEKDFDKTQWERTRCFDLLHGDEKDFDKTQWEWTRFDLHGDEKEFDKTQRERTRFWVVADTVYPPPVVKPEMKQEAPKVSSASVVVTIQPPKSAEIVRPKKAPVDYRANDAIVMVSVYLVQFAVIGFFLFGVIHGSIYYGLSTVTHFTIIIGSLLLLAFLVILFSICFEAVQWCKEESKKKTRTAMWRIRVIGHVVKALLACADFVLLFEKPPPKQMFKHLLYALLLFFILLIAEHYAKCCLDWLKEKEEERRQKMDETIDDDINRKK